MFQRLSGDLRAVASSYFVSAYLRACDRVGDRPQLRGRPFVENVGRIEIGDNFRLSSRPVQSHLVTGPNGYLEIGDDISIEHGAAVASHVHVKLGNRVRIGPFAMILDTDFHDIVNREVIPEGRAIVIDDDVRLGSRVTILRGSTVGKGASISSGSVVVGNIPAGMLAGGVPAGILGKVGEPARPLPMMPDASSSGATEGTLVERVRQVVATTFSLAEPPDLTSGPDDIESWDSLGTLHLLLALEDEFQVSLTEDDMVESKSVQDVVALLDTTRGRADGGALQVPAHA